MNTTGYIEIYGGDDDAVLTTAPGVTGVVLPTGLTEPPVTMEEVGWLAEDGIDWDDSYDKVVITAHQGGTEVIEVTTKTERTFKFRCLEETAMSLGLRYPGFAPAAVAGQTGVFGGEVPSPTADVRPWIIDLYSISNPARRHRKVIPQGQVSEVGTLAAKRGEVSIYEFTVRVLGGKFFIYGNSAGWDPA